MKTLRVCLSSELPGLLDRKSNYLYFLYDKLLLYNGQNMIDVNFAITDKVPESQIDGMIYILNTDGSVHRKVDYVDTIVAKIENINQIELLKKAGTMYYIDAEHRYIDSQRRILTLPYNDGNYELSVAAKNDAKFNNNTILKYNEKHNRFEMYGEQDEEFIDFSKPFRGKETNTVKMIADGPKLAAMVKISKAIGNIIKAASDGLSVNSVGFVNREEFDKWCETTIDFKKYAQGVLDRVDAELTSVMNLITPESIHKEIMDQLVLKYPTIDTALANYAEVAASLKDIENEVMTYSSDTIIRESNNIDSKMKEYSEWDNLDDSHETYTSETNYYEKSEEWLYPFTKSQLLSVISIGINKYIEEINKEEQEKNKQKNIKLLSIALAKYLSEDQ